MPGAAELAEVEKRISRMTDGELVEMYDHSQDYEPWAVELGRQEWERRGLAPDHVAELRAGNEVDSAQSTRRREHATAWLILKCTFLFAAIGAALIGVIANFRSETESASLSRTCAQMLAKASGGAASGNEVKLDRHSLAMTVTVERIKELPGGTKTLAGILVNCHLDGRPAPALTAGSVGIDATREDALKVAVEEWTALHGAPIVAALSGKGQVMRVGALRAYPGPTGIRGSKPEGLERLHEEFFREAAPALSQLAPDSSLHAVYLMVVRNADGVIEGEFRIDGEVSERLKQLAMRAQWPKSQQAYMLKQSYVLTGAGEAH